MVTTVNGLPAPSPTDALYSVAGTLTQLRDALASRLGVSTAAATAWVTLAAGAFSANWSPVELYGYSGVSHKLQTGVLYGVGLIKSTQVVQAEVTAFTMPTGTRPGRQAVGVIPTTLAEMKIQTNGQVRISSATPIPAGTNLPFTFAYPLGT